MIRAQVDRQRGVAMALCGAGFALVWTPWVSAALALLLGASLALMVGNPFLARTRIWTHRLLALAVVGLGAGMDLRVVGKVGAEGMGYTCIGISLTLAAGLMLGRLLGVDQIIATLIAVGTAICGGSAIAAVAPVLGAKDQDVSVALGTVFLLNALALFTFPVIGHGLGLSQHQFGLWSALAIHDTSSVVGATIQYGAEATLVGTTVKLARALWIVPVTLGIAQWVRRQGRSTPGKKPSRPWFILGFLLMAALTTWLPALQPVGHHVEWIARRLLVVTLYLIGLNLTRATVATVGPRPLAQGIMLWTLTASVTLGALCAGWLGPSSR